MILLIDNYDSFTFNLKRYFVRLGQDVTVLRNDAPELVRDLKRDFGAVVISPGPKRPTQAGKCLETIREYSGALPLLGICLGHQAIFEALGGEIGPAKRPMHGMASEIELLDSRLFDGLGERAAFARYHSLVGVLESLPDSLRVTAWSEEREIMAVEHRAHPTFGVQFHPESVLSPAGYQLLRNFLVCSGLYCVENLPGADLVEQSSLQARGDEIASTDTHAVVLPLPCC